MIRTAARTASRTVLVGVAACAALVLSGCGAVDVNLGGSAPTGQASPAPSTGSPDQGSGSTGTSTQCGLDGCRVVFPRSGQASVSVLGVQASLQGVTDGMAALEVAGQRITVPVGGETQVAGFTVAVEDVTDQQVVVRVRL